MPAMFACRLVAVCMALGACRPVQPPRAFVLPPVPAGSAVASSPAVAPNLLAVEARLDCALFCFIVLFLVLTGYAGL